MGDEIRNKLKSLSSNRPSGWEEKAEWRQANRAWLGKSAEIALKILRELRAKSVTQKELADKINVSAQYVNKLLKGQENLSLETICKLEVALGITLITIPVSYACMVIDTNLTSETMSFKTFTPSGAYKHVSEINKNESWLVAAETEQGAA